MPFNSIERLIDFSLNCCSRLFSKILKIFQIQSNLICSLPLAMIFNLLTWDNNEEEELLLVVVVVAAAAGGVKELEWRRLFEANLFVWSSVCLEKNEGERLRFTVVNGWWSSNEDIRGVVEDVSLTSRDEAAAAAARKNGLDNAAAAAMAAWFESTRNKNIIK